MNVRFPRLRLRWEVRNEVFVPTIVVFAFVSVFPVFVGGATVPELRKCMEWTGFEREASMALTVLVLILVVEVQVVVGVAGARGSVVGVSIVCA